MIFDRKGQSVLKKLKTHKLKRQLAAVLMLSSLTAEMLSVSAPPVFASFEAGFTEMCSNGEGKADNQVTGDTLDSSTDGVAGDWTQKGSPTYKVAKKIFDHMTKDLGFSGAAACGVVGNAFGESNFNPKARNSGSNCVGLFQWSAGGINGDRLHANGYIKSDDDLTVENELKLLDYECKGPYKAAAQEAAKCDDPTQAAMIWVTKYEVAAGQNDDTRCQAARQAMTVFNADSIPADLSKLAGDSDATPAGGDGQSGDNNSQSADNAGGCEKTDNASGGAEDGTGTVPEDAKGKLFAANEIPDDLKQYLLPINLSDARGVSGEKWAHPGGQCVDYSVSEACALWKDTQSWSQGNGVDQVNAAISHGYAVKDDKPHAGDIVSCDGTDPSVGHTWIVGHVFADGSVLVQEQNFPGKSGDDMGAPQTWDVGILPPWNNGDGWHNVHNWGTTMDHAQFAKPKNGMKKNPSK